MKQSIQKPPDKWLFKNAFLKITLIGALLFIILALWINYKYKKSIEAIDREIAVITEQLPKVLSEEVTWISIKRHDYLIQLIYEVQGQSDSELIDYYKDIDLKEEFGEICEMSDSKIILAKGFTWEHLYLSQDGKEISRAQLTKEVCNQIH